MEVGAKEPQFGGKCDGIHPKCLGHIPTGYPPLPSVQLHTDKPSPGVLCMRPILIPGPAASGKVYLPCSCPGSCQQLGTWAHPWGAVPRAPRDACTKDTHNRSSGPDIPMKGPESTWHRNQAGPAGKEKGVF